jgi:hypothetical protein
VRKVGDDEIVCRLDERGGQQVAFFLLPRMKGLAFL